MYMSDIKGRFHLHSDSSKFGTGSALYKIQNEQPRQMKTAMMKPLTVDMI